MGLRRERLWKNLNRLAVNRRERPRVVRADTRNLSGCFMCSAHLGEDVGSLCHPNKGAGVAIVLVLAALVMLVAFVELAAVNVFPIVGVPALVFVAFIFEMARLVLSAVVVVSVGMVVLAVVVGRQGLIDADGCVDCGTTRRDGDHNVGSTKGRNSETDGGCE